MKEGRKDDGGKSRLDLIPTEAILALGAVLTFGCEKYSPNTWQHVKNGRDRYYAAALRHLMAWRGGEYLDTESGLPHLAHALCCLMFVLCIEKKRRRKQKNVL